LSGKQKDDKAKATASLEVRRGGIRTMAALMPKVTRTILGKRGFAEASIITEWATIVGDDLARSSQPEKLSFPRGERVGGVLHIRVAGGGATELQHLEPQILERINGHFGYRAVGRLKLVHLPLATSGTAKSKDKVNAKPPHMPTQVEMRQIKEVGHAKLRTALERLGRAIAARKSR
jgi:hypothetical protein